MLLGRAAAAARPPSCETQKGHRVEDVAANGWRPPGTKLAETYLAAAEQLHQREEQSRKTTRDYRGRQWSTPGSGLAWLGPCVNYKKGERSVWHYIKCHRKCQKLGSGDSATFRLHVRHPWCPPHIRTVCSLYMRSHLVHSTTHPCKSSCASVTNLHHSYEGKGATQACTSLPSTESPRGYAMQNPPFSHVTHILHKKQL